MYCQWGCDIVFVPNSFRFSNDFDAVFRGQEHNRGCGHHSTGRLWEEPGTMSYNETGTHKKRRTVHPWVFRSTASALFVPAQGLRAQGNSLSPRPRPLPTAVLARTIGKLPKHHTSASGKSRGVNSPWILLLICWSQRSPATPPYRRSVSNTSSMSLSARTTGGHSLRERRQ